MSSWQNYLEDCNFYLFKLCHLSLQERGCVWWQDRVLTVLDGKRRGSSKSLFHTTREAGEISCGAVRVTEVDSDFSDPLGQRDINFLSVFFRHSLGLWLGEGEWSPPSLVLLVAGAQRQGGWTRHGQPGLTSKSLCFTQQPGPAGLQRSLASLFILGLCSETILEKGKNQLFPSPSFLLCHEQGDVQEII